MRLTLTVALIVLIAAPALGQADAPGPGELPPGLTPGPGQAARDAVLHQIEAIEAGQPDYTAMTPDEAATFRSLVPSIQAGLRQWGALKTITFLTVEPNGLNEYDAEIEHGQAIVWIGPLDVDGRVNAFFLRDVPTGVSCCRVGSGR